MARIETVNVVREYPDKDGAYSTLRIKNHWNDKNKVVIQVNNGDLMTFFANDLLLAIANAQNAH